MGRKTKKRIIAFLCSSVLLTAAVFQAPQLKELTQKLTVASAGLMTMQLPDFFGQSRSSESGTKTIFHFQKLQTNTGTSQGTNPSGSPEAPIPPRPQNAGDIIEECFKLSPSTTVLSYGKGLIKNNTKLSAEAVMAELSKKSSFSTKLDGKVEVLIYHSHATESYEAADWGYYLPNVQTRTTDKEKSVVRVGKELGDILTKKGIGVIHDTTLYDYPSYTGSYQRSAEGVKANLQKYPTIKLAIDIHRDAIQRTETVKVKPTAVINGKKAAQVMILAGWDDGTLSMPNWAENFRLAAKLTDKSEQLYSGLTRPVYLNYSRYNEHIFSHLLAVEFGSDANTLEEAVYSAQLMGEVIYQVMKEDKG